MRSFGQISGLPIIHACWLGAMPGVGKGGQSATWHIASAPMVALHCRLHRWQFSWRFHACSVAQTAQYHCVASRTYAHPHDRSRFPNTRCRLPRTDNPQQTEVM